MNSRNVSCRLTVLIVSTTVSFIARVASGLMTGSLKTPCYGSQLHRWCNILNAAANPIMPLFNNLSITLVNGRA